MGKSFRKHRVSGKKELTASDSAGKIKFYYLVVECRIIFTTSRISSRFPARQKIRCREINSLALSIVSEARNISLHSPVAGGPFHPECIKNLIHRDMFVLK